MSFDYLAHTADLAAVVRGRSLDELYQAGAALVRDALVGPSHIRPLTIRELHLSAIDPDERFFEFVRELLFLYDSEAFLVARVELMDVAAGLVRVAGEPFENGRHESERQIKALTRHDYSFEHGPDGYRAVLLFDL